jgi:ribosome-associated heat shock protein Hsp15
MESNRVDKWLWTVRLCKSRSLATKYCKESKVRINDKPAKPSAHVTIDDKVEVKRNGFLFTYEVKGLLKSRVSATLAAPCYNDVTPESELNKFKSWFIGKAGSEKRLKGEGRPTKRDRRELDIHKWTELYLEDEPDDLDEIE